MSRTLSPFVAAAALAPALLASGCSLFRRGEDVPPEALLNGDTPAISVVQAIAEAAPHDAEDPAMAAAGMPQSGAPPLASRSVLFALHLASYRTESSAEAGWRILTAEAPDALGDLHPRVETVDLGPDRGVYLRLKAGPLDSRAEASARCAELVDTGHYCQAVDFEGRDLPG